MGQISVGRQVHYFEHGAAEPLPAVVTKVWSDECVNLQVFQDGPGGLMYVTSVTRRDPEQLDPGWGWEWPPRVE